MEDRKLTCSTPAIALFDRPQVQSPEPLLSPEGRAIPPPECGGAPSSWLGREGGEPQSGAAATAAALTWNQAAVGSFSPEQLISDHLLNHSP